MYFQVAGCIGVRMEIFKTFVRSLSNLKSYYRLENGAFTTDSGASGKTLTNNGTVAEGTGKYGVGADFGASNSSKYFTSSDSSYLPTGDFTYSLWFKTAMTGTGHWVICDNNSGGAGITFRMNSNTNIQARIMLNGGAVGDLNITSLTAFNDNAWHHVVFTRTGSAMVLYLDNAVIGSGNSTGNPNFSAAKNLYFGAYFNGSQDFFSGLIDDVAILDVGITADVVDLLYRDRNYIGEFLGTTSTKGLYRLSSTTDYSGNGNNLTNNNTVTFVAGKFGNCADFGTSNTDKYLRISSAMGISNGVITVSLWVRMNTEIATNTVSRLFCRGEAATDVRHWISYNDTSGTPYLQFNRQRENIANDSFNYNVTLGTTIWHHVVLTYDGTNVRGYLNGAYLNAVASSGNGASGVFADNTTIGAAETNQPNSNPSLFANADIDEVIIENRAWSTPEVRKYYAMATGRYL